MAGTWQWTELNWSQENNGGWRVRVDFTRDTTGEISSHTFAFTNEAEITAEGAARFAKKISHLELRWSILNNMDFGDESVTVLRKLIVAVRNNPNLQANQAVTWYNTNYPDAVWDGAKLLLKFQKYLTKELGFEPTWDQFKTYVINHVFGGIDG